jgi:serine/threonine protein kinase
VTRPRATRLYSPQNAETQAQLVNEVKLMSGFSHPGIVKVHASESRREGRDGLEILVVMEFCPGAWTDRQGHR